FEPLGAPRRTPVTIALAHGGAAMARRRLLPLSRLILAAPAALAGLLVIFVSIAARADDEPTVPNAKYNFIGQITGNGVSVRSGPREHYYPTGKTDKDVRGKVVGIMSNSPRIHPP